MKPIDRFLQLLAARHAHFEWIGWQMSGNSSMGLLGSFIAYRARPKGFEITIAFHDYRGKKIAPRGFLAGKVFGRRGISIENSHWIEMMAEDTRVRYGRKTVLPKTMFFPGEEDFKILSGIFDKIKEKSPIFVPHAGNRLSSDESLLAMCEEIS